MDSKQFDHFLMFFAGGWLFCAGLIAMNWLAMILGLAGHIWAGKQMRFAWEDDFTIQDG